MSAKPRPESPEIHPGVREIEHTADLGMQVEAATVEQLFDRAAAGMMALVRGNPGSDVRGPGRQVRGPRRQVSRPGRQVRGARLQASEPKERVVELENEQGDIPGLLVRWLRELLYLQEVDGFVYAGADFERLDGAGLRARVRRDAAPAPQIRELKGVTYHGLEVERTGPNTGGPGKGAWQARVIFDI